MNAHIFPVPVGERIDFETDDVIEKYIHDEVSPSVFDRETLFLILLIGENPEDKRDEVRNALLSNRQVEHADELRKIDVVTPGEQRLNDFILSLMYNCLDVDSGRDPANVITDESIIGDDVRRKIDFYLPKVNERLDEAEDQLTNRFRDRQEELLPVDLESDPALGLFQTLADDIVSDDPIVDYCLLAGAASESRRDTKNLVEYIREKGLDDAGILSKIRGSGGYQRIFSNAYNRKSDDFFPRFTEAISLYEDGVTEVQTLTTLYSAPDYKDVYSIDYPAADVLLHRFSGNSQQLGQYVLEAVLISRIISKNEDNITSDYESGRSDLREKIDELNDLISDIGDLNDWFDDDKIVYNAKNPAVQAEGLITEVNKTDNSILQFIFGVDRSQRTSVFTTVKRHLEAERQNLKSNLGPVESRVNTLQNFESELEETVDTIDSSYDAIDSSTVEVPGLPDRSAFRDYIKTEWDRILDETTDALSVIDLSEDQSDIREAEREWGETIGDTDDDLDDLRGAVNNLEEVQSHVDKIEEVRSESEEKLTTIDETLGVKA